jgi:hypothetical protein
MNDVANIWRRTLKLNNTQYPWEEKLLNVRCKVMSTWVDNDAFHSAVAQNGLLELWLQLSWVAVNELGCSSIISVCFFIVTVC